MEELSRFPIEYVTSFMEVFAAIVVAAILVSGFARGRMKQRRHRNIASIMFAQIVVLVMDAYAYNPKGNTPGIWMIIYLVTISQLVMFQKYFHNNMLEYGVKLKKDYTIITIAAALLSVLFMLIAVYRDQIYLNSSTGVSYGLFWALSQMMLAIAFLLDLWMLFRHHRKLGRKRIQPYIVYFSIMAVALLVEPFWNESLLYLADSIAIILMYLNINMEGELEKALIEKELHESKTKLMMSQIQPHFVFNALSSIKQVCIDPKTSELIQDFADYLRMNLDTISDSQNIPFDKELQHTEAYLRIEQLRFQNRLTVVYAINARDFMLPPLTIQPLAENAVKHGICQKRGGGTLLIRTEETDKYYEVIVSDDGVGFDTSKSPQERDGRVHVGLENVKERLKLSANADMIIESQVGKGTSVTIRLPK